MNAHQSVTIVMIEDDEGHARLIEKNIRRAGIMNDIKHFTDGTTALGDLSRTSKTDLRLAAYADANEANAAIGVAVACGGLPDDVRAAFDAILAGALDGVDAVFAVHCDPSLDVGQVGLREGPITAACAKP